MSQVKEPNAEDKAKIANLMAQIDALQQLLKDREKDKLDAKEAEASESDSEPESP